MKSMAQLVYQFADPVWSPDGVPYVVQVWGEPGPRWRGWLVFIAADGRILRTEREISQDGLDALRTWALHLRPIDLEGALARAVPASAERPAA